MTFNPTRQQFHLIHKMGQQQIEVNASLPINYTNLKAQLLDATGESIHHDLSVQIKDSIHFLLVLPPKIQGVFQLRLQVDEHYFIKKLILQ